MKADEFIIRTTIRIEVLTKDGLTASGTGFFYQFQIDDANVPVIITNKHVVKDAVEGYMFFSVCDESGKIIESKKHRLTITDFEKSWIMHPDSNIDLCILPIAEILKHSSVNKWNLVCHFLMKENIIDDNIVNELSRLEDVTIVGYPDGIWDSYNNLPIVRRGITATPIQFNFENEPKFLIDAAIYGGSSGSPVFIFNQGSYSINNTLYAGSRLMLIGIVFAVAQHTVTGDLRIVDVPTNCIPQAVTNIPNNLGVVIKAKKILDFESIIREILDNKKGVDPNQ